MMLWLTTAARYLLGVFAALLSSVVVSFFTVLLFSGTGDDSLAAGFALFFVFLGVGSLLVPLSLGTTGELVQCRVLVQSFSWPNALFRSLLALPIVVGPLYAVVRVFPYVENRRPTHWVGKVVSCCALSGISPFSPCAFESRPGECSIDVLTRLATARVDRFASQTCESSGGICLALIGFASI
jgi:hypothetical protein